MSTPLTHSSTIVLNRVAAEVPLLSAAVRRERFGVR
jgi:hypothetical protein